jgi:hypothetical protein
MKKLALLFFLLSSIAAAQGVGARVGPNNVLQQATVAGISNVVVTASSPIIHFCAHPANAVPCTNYATTYTDATLGTPCSTSTQIVLDGTNTCVGTPDQYTNWGVWVPAGNYDYTITLSNGSNLGPYSVSAGGSASGTCPQGNAYSIQEANSVTSTCQGIGPGIAGQQPVSQGPSAATIMASPGLTDSTNSPVSTTPYALACDNSSTIVDRAHSMRFTSGAAAVTIPLSTASGCAGLLITAFNDGAGTLTFSVTSPDVVNVYDGVAATDNQTSFQLNSGQHLTLTQAASGLWEARKTAATVCTTSQKSETGADTNVLTCTPVSAAGTYRLHLNLSLSAATSATLGWTATWKDSNGNSQAPTNLPICISSAGTCGATTGALSSAVTASGDYYVDINNSGTSIVIKLTFSGTSFSGKVSATIERLI